MPPVRRDGGPPSAGGRPPRRGRRLPHRGLRRDVPGTLPRLPPGGGQALLATPVRRL